MPKWTVTQGRRCSLISGDSGDTCKVTSGRDTRAFSSDNPWQMGEDTLPRHYEGTPSGPQHYVPLFHVFPSPYDSPFVYFLARFLPLAITYHLSTSAALVKPAICRSNASQMPERRPGRPGWPGRPGRSGWPGRPGRSPREECPLLVGDSQAYGGEYLLMLLGLSWAPRP